MFKIKKIIKHNQRIFNVAKALRFLLRSSFVKIDGSLRKYPKVIQLPLTYKCNSRCVMCNIWQMDHSNEMSTAELCQFLNDPLFSSVEAVGINGGEPSCISNLPEYANEILRLPKLRSLNVISNGFSQKPLLKSLEAIYQACRKKGVSFQVSISLDGVGKVHDTIRGRRHAFEKTTSTLDEIASNQHKYCDSFNAACTIVQQNIDFLIELDAYAKLKCYPMKYRLGIDNKRIESDKLRDHYSVLYNTSRQTAAEFMHSRFCQAKTLVDKFKYFSIFYFLSSRKPKRLMGCTWKDEGITMDARGSLYYCAVASEKIGGLREKKGCDIFFSDQNIEYRKDIIATRCDTCIHDYEGKPELKNLIIFFKALLADRLAIRLYQYKCKLGLI